MSDHRGASGVFSEDALGPAVLCSYGSWLVIVTGWLLLIGVAFIIEVTCGD